MHIVMFERRFVSLVRRGVKTHTIRPRRKRPIHVGDALSLRCWRGLAYRSRQQQINQGFVVSVAPIRIDRGPRGMPDIDVDGTHLLANEANLLAIADGFQDVIEFLEWRHERYGLPWSGQLITWRNVPLSLWRKKTDARCTL